MRTIETTTEIDAPPEAVWAVLTDTAAYPDWNPFVRSFEGDLRVGARLQVRLHPPGGRAITMRPTIRVVDAPSELRWLGRLGLPRIFDGEHRFTVEPLDGGTRSRFVQAETFRGVLVPLVGSVLRSTEAGFEAMNDALRDRVAAVDVTGH
jgi:hypothetical protein